MTEADTLQFRVRSYDDFNSEDTTVGANGKKDYNKAEDTETRYRWVHSFGTIGDTKIKLASRLELRQTDAYDKVEAQARFDFVNYIPDYKYLNTTKFLFAPKVRYTELDGTGTGSDDTSTGVGMDFEYYAITAGEWEWEVNVYYAHAENPGDYKKSTINGDATRLTGGDGVPSSNDLSIEFYTYWTHKIWNSEDKFYQINTYLENGLDPYTVDSGEDDGSYTIYTWPELQLQMNLNPATKMTFGVGAYYENEQSNDDKAQDWEWQPMATARVKTTF